MSGLPEWQDPSNSTSKQSTALPDLGSLEGSLFLLLSAVEREFPKQILHKCSVLGPPVVRSGCHPALRHHIQNLQTHPPAREDKTGHPQERSHSVWLVPDPEFTVQ